MGVDNLPSPVQTLIHLGRVPPRGGFWAAVELGTVVDEIEREHSEIAAALNLGIDQLGLLDFDLAGKRREIRLQRVLAVDALGGRRIEIRLIRRHDLKEPLRVAPAPPVERPTLERDDGLRLKVIRRAATREPARG